MPSSDQCLRKFYWLTTFREKMRMHWKFGLVMESRMILKAVRFLAPWFGAHVDTMFALPTVAGIIAS
jgi:hypothetical protein